MPVHRNSLAVCVPTATEYNTCEINRIAVFTRAQCVNNSKHLNCTRMLYIYIRCTYVLNVMCVGFATTTTTSSVGDEIKCIYYIATPFYILAKIKKKNKLKCTMKQCLAYGRFFSYVFMYNI